jgi:7-cyano-7-deazaguanine reductase
MSQTTRHYSKAHAAAGVDARLPGIECWENIHPGYAVELVFPEFTSVCPKTGLPDFGTLTLRYGPDKLCLETKSLKLYLTAYRNLGIFTENVVNRVLKDVVRHARPKWAAVEGVFAARGGLTARITARYKKEPHP